MKRLIALSIVIFILCVCGAAQAAEPVKIGVIAPLTGSQANIGMGVVNGIKAATKRINAQGG